MAIAKGGSKLGAALASQLKDSWGVSLRPRAASSIAVLVGPATEDVVAGEDWLIVPAGDGFLYAGWGNGETVAVGLLRLVDIADVVLDVSQLWVDGAMVGNARIELNRPVLGRSVLVPSLISLDGGESRMETLVALRDRVIGFSPGWSGDDSLAFVVRH